MKREPEFLCTAVIPMSNDNPYCGHFLLNLVQMPLWKWTLPLQVLSGLLRSQPVRCGGCRPHSEVGELGWLSCLLRFHSTVICLLFFNLLSSFLSTSTHFPSDSLKLNPCLLDKQGSMCFFEKHEVNEIEIKLFQDTSALPLPCSCGEVSWEL